MEIERKFLVKKMPEDLETYPCLLIEQAYLCTDPVVRIRRQDNSYYMTYKGKGMMVREEYNLPLNEKAYLHLKAKADGHIIAKKRYRIPLGTLTAELDIFSVPKELTLVEVEFSTEDEALSFCPPDWFGEDVTSDSRYHNSNMI
ncbi:CYTH domain-containing protein [Lacrimispora sp. NSJ-141]|uniref:CYTH domain-containing protein n=1 Tax=Lientehia hominis TaxID=2897778 RepID=A0AAP2RIZ8_9FIRM|nr:CYTH domain-containing protein [Lientehia hominis]